MRHNSTKTDIFTVAMGTTRWLIVFFVISIWTLTEPVDGNVVDTLVKDLLENYSRPGRPLRNYNHTLNLTFSLTFVSANIDEQDQSLSLVAYENLKWQDDYLVWNPQKYGGVDNVILDRKHIWNPDLTLYNPANDVDVTYGQGNAVAFSQGIVNLVRISKSKVRCTSKPLNFPFDSIECSLKFGSWVYSGRKINLTVPETPADMSLYQDNPKWHIKSVSAHRDTFIYPGFPEPYYTVIYKAKFSRVWCPYVGLLIFPSTLLMILNLCLFRLPSLSPGRMIFGFLLFGAYLGLLLLTFTLVSISQTIPYFVVFLLFNLLTLVLSIHYNFAIGIVVKMEAKLPNYMKKIVFGFVARIFCMGHIVKRYKLRRMMKPEKEDGSPNNGYYRLPTPSEKPALKGENEVSYICTSAEQLQQGALGTESKGNTQSEWEDLADVHNKLFVWIYILSLICGGLVAYTNFFGFQ